MFLGENIEELALRQHGLVTRGQLLGLGETPKVIAGRVRARQFRSICRGVYQLGVIPGKRSREMAAFLSAGKGAVVSHLSALSLWELMDLPADQPVHITLSGRGRPSTPNITFHRTVRLSPAECSEVDGIPVTSVERTLVDAAQLLGSHELGQIIATIERRGLLLEKDWRALPDRYARMPGVRVLREVLGGDREPAFTRSEAERRCLALIRTARLPQPSVNITFDHYELDLYWPEERVAVEVDGFAFHGSRRSFEADRRKDGYLRSRGVEVVRLTWRQITDEPTATAVIMGQVLARASERRAQVMR